MEFRILGPLEVVEDGRPLPLQRRRMRALLAFLLLHANELVSADRLIDEVWGPAPPKTAGASLQNYVSRLRKVIGAETIVSQPPGYVLRVDPERVDVARFERLSAEARRAKGRERAEKLRAALALWRGPALDDLAFEPFARDEVGRLQLDPPVLPHASGMLGAALSAMLVAGTAASETVTSAAASSFFVFDI